MRTTAAARYARWSAAIAVLIALTVAGLYLRRDWQARLTTKEMPAAVPPAVQQQSAGFSFSKVEGDRTEFTIRATKATQYAGDGHSLLEDVWVTLYGKTGDRLDNLRTHSCQYMVSTGDISCAGKVQIDMQSAEDARRHPAAANHANAAARIIHVDTSGIVFNQKTGSAATDQLVVFRFPQGEGHGVGFRYDSGTGQVQLLHDVSLVFHQPIAVGLAQPPEGSAADVTASGSSLIFLQSEHRLHLFGPVSAQQGTRNLSAEGLKLEFDSQLRPQRLVATGNPVLRETSPGIARTIAADEISATFSATGWLESSLAEGNVRGTAKSAKRDDHLDADRAELSFAEASNRPQQITATGKVRVRSVLLPEGESRNLETSELVLDFAKAERDGAASIEHVKTPAATMDFEGRTLVSGQSVPEHIRLTSRHLDADFAEGNQLYQVLGGGGTELRRQIGDQPLQISASRDMAARFVPGGEWSTIDQTGEVRLSQADRTASADHAHFDHAGDTAAVAGAVVLADARTRTTAQSGVLRQGEHELRLEGRVVSNDISAASSVTNLGSGPARISADHMVADTVTGHAVYSGRARLWQGDSLVEANTIELDRSTQTLTATERVNSVFPQARWTAPGEATAAKTRAPKAKDEYWHTQARRMTYNSQAGLGHLEGEVNAESEQGRIRADMMDLFFEPVDGSSAPTGTTATPSAEGAIGGKQLVRATADGHVVADQEDRHGTATHADYAAEAGKIVLSGGPPAIHDSSGNVTTGRQLTLYFRDDTINVDSAEGMRTVTLHRVEK